jgi:hypothetical protein
MNLLQIKENKMGITNEQNGNVVLSLQRSIVITNQDSSSFLGLLNQNNDPISPEAEVLESHRLENALHFGNRMAAIRTMIAHSVFCEVRGLTYIQEVALDDDSLDRIL